MARPSHSPRGAEPHGRARELLLENSTRCLADDPRLAAAFAALAGLIRTRGPEHDERPADREQVRIVQRLATAAYAARDLGPVIRLTGRGMLLHSAANPVPCN
jgi:hypothetical protein